MMTTEDDALLRWSILLTIAIVCMLWRMSLARFVLHPYGGMALECCAAVTVLASPVVCWAAFQLLAVRQSKSR